MPRGLNKVMLIGNLGREPEMRYTPDGTAVTTFSLAASRMWATSSGERREVTEWFNVVAWRRLAEICSKHLTEGTRVYVEGRLQTRVWDDVDGTRRQRVEIVAGEMIILDHDAGTGHEPRDTGDAEACSEHRQESQHEYRHVQEHGTEHVRQREQEHEFERVHDLAQESVEYRARDAAPDEPEATDTTPDRAHELEG